MRYKALHQMLREKKKLRGISSPGCVSYVTNITKNATVEFREDTLLKTITVPLQKKPIGPRAGVPTPGPRTGSSVWPVRNHTAQKVVSSRPVSKGSFICIYSCFPSLALLPASHLLSDQQWD